MTFKNSLFPLLLGGFFSPCLLNAADLQLSTGPAYIGVDPLGTEMLRVGGSARFTGDVLQANGKGINLGVDGAYFGVGAFYGSGGWSGYTAGQGGSVIRNSSGTLEIISGTSGGIAGAPLLALKTSLSVLGSGNVIVGSPLVVHKDELLRVGGSARFIGDVVQGNTMGINLAPDGAYFGIGAYYNNGWRSYNASQGGAIIRNSGGTLDIITGTNTAGADAQLQGVVSRLVVLGNGNIGIGVAIPVAKLEVAGPMVVGSDPAPGASTALRVGGTFMASRSGYGTVWTGRGDSLLDLSSMSGTNGRVLSIHGASTTQSLVEVYGFNGSAAIPVLICGVSNSSPSVQMGDYPGATGMLRVGGGACFAGNVGIGVINPTSKLAVAGTISASEVKVTANPADYVFADDYKLRPLSEVETHVKANRHLPGVPSAQEQVQAGSVSLSEMQRLHLEKIEELTLYAIQAEKRSEMAESKLNELTARLDRQQKLIDGILRAQNADAAKISK